jgi:hypothetical protein
MGIKIEQKKKQKKEKEKIARMVIICKPGTQY